MKKIIIALISGTFAVSAFAAQTTTVSFDSTQMKCGKVHVDDGINKDKLKTMHCKKFQDKKTDVLFWDDNSKKLVDCKVDNVGNITLTQCSAH